MKLSKFSQIAGAGIIAFSLANLLSVVPASAQTSGSSGSGMGTDSTTGTTGTGTTGTGSNYGTGTGTGSDYTTTGYRDSGFDWGWLGLIGLAGLAGLGGKNRQEHTSAYRDPNIR